MAVKSDPEQINFNWKLSEGRTREKFCIEIRIYWGVSSFILHHDNDKLKVKNIFWGMIQGLLSIIISEVRVRWGWSVTGLDWDYVSVGAWLREWRVGFQLGFWILDIGSLPPSSDLHVQSQSADASVVSYKCPLSVRWTALCLKFVNCLPPAMSQWAILLSAILVLSLGHQ